MRGKLRKCSRPCIPRGILHRAVSLVGARDVLALRVWMRLWSVGPTLWWVWGYGTSLLILVLLLSKNQKYHEDQNREDQCPDDDEKEEGTVIAARSDGAVVATFPVRTSTPASALFKHLYGDLLRYVVPVTV